MLNLGCPKGTAMEIRKDKLWCRCETAICGKGCGCTDEYSNCGYCRGSNGKGSNYGAQGNCKEGMVGYGCGSGGCWCGFYANQSESTTLEPYVTPPITKAPGKNIQRH